MMPRAPALDDARPRQVFSAWWRLIARPAPWQAELNASASDALVPAST
jgi:hypothetical protein